ncbi:hypothetical protein OE88DRAFT_208120 [Heliocybe sulcata]|uniref:Uncharacterized protein n=1 Tax=Heliocybe sulcata TaxID=5364 RepID=A0A5C3N3N6_9AGAM|nr:hypothetical protein OE88DRAFT_208120 [Heliocybe sulcata]
MHAIAMGALVLLIVLHCAISLLTARSLVSTARTVRLSRRPVHRLKRTDMTKYSFEGEDVPLTLALDLPLVAMEVQESVHYSITNPETADEWLYNSPPGTGGFRFGERHRGFFSTFFHQLHCYRILRNDFVSGVQNRIHTQHCFNFLRLSILCQADLTLERGDFATRDFEADRVSEVHVCQDWEKLYDAVGHDWLSWLHYAKANNITVPLVNF